MTRKMKDSGVDWIGEIPEDWEIVRNKNLFGNKKEIVGNKFETTDRLALTLNGVIDRDKFDSEGLQPTNFDTYQKVYKNNLIFKLIDLENINTSRVGLAHKDGMVSPAYVVLHSNNKKDMRFYHYFYLSMWHRNIFNMLGDGGVRSNLNKTDLLNLNTLRADYNIQKAIADFLDEKTQEIDNIISKTKKAIEEYKKYKQSLITETVTKGLDKNVEMKDSGIEWIGEIPERWDLVKLKYLVNCNEQTLSSTTSGDYEFRYIDIGSVDFHKGIMGYEVMKYKDSPSRARRIVKKGDLIVSTVRTYLRAIVTIEDDEDIIVSTGFAVLTPINVNEKYLEYLTKTEYFISEVIKNSVGVSYPAINSKELLEIKIAFPPLKEQEEISSYLNKKTNQIDQIISTKEKLLIEMEAYKKSLIYETVTGKREVE